MVVLTPIGPFLIGFCNPGAFLIDPSLVAVEELIIYKRMYVSFNIVLFNLKE